MYNPCQECKLRYNREYSKECDTTCDYAKEVLINKQYKDQVFEQIATYFEKQRNWNHFKEDCWLANGRSDDFRQMLKYAMGLEEEPQNGRDWITSRMTESMEC